MAVVMGTAGHIDHGKTSLIRALTGIDCDRLDEEKRRGITIELGFAFLPLPDGSRLGIVDVPGHERFVRTMVAGASGIDFVCLVIAADEGVMPQTREHLEICALMGIRHGLIALTKADTVDAGMLELARDDAADTLAGTFLEGAPMFAVSAVTGQGLDELRRGILDMAASLAPRHHGDIFRLPVDRVFSIRGHGTMVTGTLVSGRIAPDEEIEMVPSGLRARVKSIQSHGDNVERAGPGQRTSLNLAGLEVADIHRGQIAARPGSLFASSRWLLSVSCLLSSPRGLKQREELHFHHGTREERAKLHFADREALRPGETALAEARFAGPMAGVFGDHCVLRLFSPLRTAAGAVLLAPILPRLGAGKLRNIPEELRARLLALPEASPVERVHVQARLSGAAGLRWPELAVLTCLEEKKLDRAVQELVQKRELFCFHKESRAYVCAEGLEYWKARFLERAALFHRQNPLIKGMSRGWLLTGVDPALPPQMALFVLNQLIRDEKLRTEDELVRLADFSVEPRLDDEQMAVRILAAHRGNPLTPPMLRHFLDEARLTGKQVAPVLKMLVQKGELVKINEDLYYDAAALDELKSRVRAWFADHTDMAPGDFKAVAGLTRKYAVPLLEYFDNTHFTMRVGNERRLRKT
ncbi:MAG: selenocysteine-specific translation elongation factor [Desulfovibrionaceae bacterium]|nr:selenocysteine-specific translation elongation factor [Desulfovibrionaceae bacterium]